MTEPPGRTRSDRRLTRLLPPLVLLLIIIFWHGGWIRRAADGIVNPGDPLLTAWILGWDAHQVLRDPLRLFQANIFYPHADTLAFSEHLFFPALLSAPIQYATGNPILAQNVSILLAQALLGLAVYIMCRGLGLDVFPSVAAALLTVLAPVRMMRLGHLHLLHFACFPLALYFLHRYLEERRWRDALAAGLLLNAQFLSGYYLAVMAGIGAFLYLLAYALRGPFSYLRGALPGLLAIGVATVLIQVPFLIPYFRVSREWQFTRSLAESEAHSGVPADLARRPNNQIPIPGFLSAGTPRDPERLAYVGAGVALLAGVAVAAALRRRGWVPGPLERLTPLYFAAVAVVAGVIFLGPTLRVQGQDVPFGYRVLHEFVPGLKGLRAPARFVLLLDLALCVLAGIGLHVLLRRARSRGGKFRFAGPAVAGALLALAVAERLPRRPTPPHSVETGAAVPAVYRWLASRPDLGVLLFLPMTSGRPTAGVNFDPTPYREVYFSTYHGKDMVNGISGFIPRGFWELATDMNGFPSDASLRRLAELPVRTLVLHRDLLEMPPDPAALRTRGFEILFEDERTLVARVPRAPALSPPSGASGGRSSRGALPAAGGCGESASIDPVRTGRPRALRSGEFPPAACRG